MAAADLNYSITFRFVWGTAGDKPIRLKAWSGGRGGSKTKGAVDWTVANNVFQIGRKTVHNEKDPTKDVHGGPLPIGQYDIESPEKHPKLGLAAKLTPVAGGFTFGMFGRDGFYIHGRGKHGSDGCIVPAEATDFQSLMTALKASGGGKLSVFP